MSKPVIARVIDLCKEFSIIDPETGRDKTFHALSGISFDVLQGDVLSIIGNNGSGKSTLLKILSHITRPTKGEIQLYGTSISILDIGNNFHPDLTGRENVLLQLKMNRKDKDQFDHYIKEIVDFSEIGVYFDQPIKHYSSGMFLRLAFSLAFHVSADILILDEVLSVGDEGFRLKCQEVLKKLTEAGRTIIFVSHNRSEIMELSNKCIWLDKGQIRKTGTPAAILGEYFARHKDNFDGTKDIVEMHTTAQHTSPNGNVRLEWNEADAPGNEYVALRKIEIKPASGKDMLYNTEATLFEFLLYKKIHLPKFGIFFFIQDVFYQPVLVGHFLNNSSGRDVSQDTAAYKGLLNINCTIPAGFLMPGQYYVQLRFGMEENEWHEESKELLRFSEKLSFTLHAGNDYKEIVGDVSKGSVRPALQWICNKV